MPDRPTPPHAVILAGGSGTRLWPLSRLQSPKQFLPLAGDETLIEATISRLAPLIPASQVLIVASAETGSGEGYHLLEPYDRLLEPVARNTAPAVAVSALKFTLAGLDPVLVVLPADHLVTGLEDFHRNLRTAIAAAESGKLALFGLPPVRPETGFGYIVAEGSGDVRRARSFHEKPDASVAKGLIAAGNCYWNSGMFAWRASVILAEVRRHLPSLVPVLDAIAADVRAGRGFQEAMAAHLADAPSISIDKGVLEKSDNVWLVPASFGWSDIGSWASVLEVAARDASGNAVQGSVIAIDCKDSLVRSESRLVAALGVENLVIVETADAVLVARADQSQRVREIVERVSAASGKEHLTHVTVTRPWGKYTVLEERPGYKLKRIEVRPGGRLSLQSHARRSEHWVVVSGVATVTIDGEERSLVRDESTRVALGARHRLENRGDTPLQLIEVQVGDYVEEDDVQRYDDVYGRS
ncbi:mannose-1-phosphate guanylyltransferase/mannose-6-phosphate isomerase [Usitatibacter palustris]|uniref:mannose-1-phosphate guanylyltransferase n=1 Tax=Usitatibacter palustris TaxID=2732487 RepID=A0A6M4HB41_9PROT|nr:mannose-1-phosphate guanylyltransferase/mannose-6-phosphate isomerase [Usitatibacter palustris]QJR15684.1 Alginate biosynthesis protein AlgA [Usitatibacter palustris]